MKRLCFCLLLSLTIGNAFAEHKTKTQLSAADDGIVRAWLAHANADSPQVKDGRIVLNFDDRDSYCAYMRTYRVQRESSDSDVTRPVGYTTCVPASRFAVKRSTKPRLETTPSK